MKTDEINDYRELRVRSVGFGPGQGPGQGPVFYGSLTTPRAPCTGQGRSMQGTAEEKLSLIYSLWNHIAAIGRPSGLHQPFGFDHAWGDSPGLSLQVVKGRLGRPHLLVGGRPGPAISFCRGEGKIFAALCTDGSDMGIDAAHPREFQGNYPYDRVFHPKEIDHALALANGKIETAAALLWSVKEAVVKALGCAFHLMAPQQITVYPSSPGRADNGQEHEFWVGESKKSCLGFPMAGHMTGNPGVRVRSFFHKEMWLSIALLGPSSGYADPPVRFIPRFSKRIP